tara:strand:- start:1577 stop:2299 length:723 start_codon:yes stop_codon:yes gene_type:complete
MMTTKTDNPSKKEIWETLSKINVNEHTESKMNLTYLSWAWAWKCLKDNYPQASYKFTTWTTDVGRFETDYLAYNDDTGSVECTITIGDQHESMWLPIMDNRNNAIQNPNARQVSDAKMRCLVKCISMLGLGLYIYAGEDVPQEATAPEPEPKPKAKAKAKPKAKESAKPAEPARPDPTTDDNPNKVSLTLITLAGEAKSMDELTEFYKTNKSAFDRLSVSDPESHKEVIEYFTKIKNSFQ